MTSSFSASDSGRFERVLVVHAHPDDESIVTGATLATLVRSGAGVTVVTCTRGELGDVIPDDLAGLRSAPERLAVHREGEIARAMAVLGVTDHRFLGAQDARGDGLPPRPYRDSGMEWGPGGTPVPVSDLHPASFCAADFGEIVADLAAVVTRVQPDAIISYDADGGYGHPDHVRTHRAALRVARDAGVPFYAIARNGTADGGGGQSAAVSPAYGERNPAGAPALVDVVIDGTPVLEAKTAALAEYRSQLEVLDTVGGPALRFPHGVVEPVGVVEAFRLVPEHAVSAPQPGSATGSALLDGIIMRDLGWSGRLVAYLLALVLGAVFGAIGTVAHQETLSVGSTPVWSGLVLSLVLVAATVAGFRLVFDSRTVGICAAFGIVAVIAVLSPASTGGSVLIPGNSPGYVWTFGPTVISLVVLAWPRLPDKMRRATTRRPRDPRQSYDQKEQTRP